ncbi:hypothetical protein ACFE04_020012 [Oxalis oulophora]
MSWTEKSGIATAVDCLGVEDTIRLGEVKDRLADYRRSPRFGLRPWRPCKNLLLSPQSKIAANIVGHRRVVGSQGRGSQTYGTSWLRKHDATHRTSWNHLALNWNHCVAWEYEEMPSMVQLGR